MPRNLRRWLFTLEICDVLLLGVPQHQDPLLATDFRTSGPAALVQQLRQRRRARRRLRGPASEDERTQKEAQRRVCGSAPIRGTAVFEQKWRLWGLGRAAAAEGTSGSSASRRSPSQLPAFTPLPLPVGLSQAPSACRHFCSSSSVMPSVTVRHRQYSTCHSEPKGAWIACALEKRRTEEGTPQSALAHDPVHPVSKVHCPTRVTKDS